MKEKRTAALCVVFSDSVRILLPLMGATVLGYLIGAVRIRGIGFGTVGIFLAGMLFGALGFGSNAALQNMGLLLFMTAVGFSAGPGFVRSLRKNGRNYIILCLSTAAIGALLVLGFVKLGGVDAPLTVGLMTGAFTTSPGFAAAKDAVAADAVKAARVSAGYGIGYPVGMICKVLMIQLIPRMLHADMEKERRLLEEDAPASTPEESSGLRRLDSWGMLPFGFAVLVGLLLGSVRIPLPGGAAFSLGIVGGPLAAGLLLGHIGHVGSFSLLPKQEVYGPAKEIGLILFFSTAGIEGGRGLAAVFSEYGAVLLLYVAVLVTVPFLLGFVILHFVLKMKLLNGLGCLTASMTCTPSLAMLIELAGTDAVAGAYATTYPIALILMVLLNQFLVTL